jgi:predicted methyltransferase
MSKVQPDFRTLFRLALFLACAVLILLGLNTLYSFTNTLKRLDQVELERDQWQRPLDVVQALDLREGNTVVDLGSGAGYFALKLSSAVGKRGEVLAVDLRRLPLFFLWTRARLRGQQNVHVIIGEEDDPRLPTGTVDAVLVLNAYHEFSHPERTLDHIFQSLRPGGRMVVADRAARAAGPEPAAEHAHEMALTVVEDALRRKGFEIVSQDDRFIDRPGDELWWLVIGRKP